MDEIRTETELFVQQNRILRLGFWGPNPKTKTVSCHDPFQYFTFFPFVFAGDFLFASLQGGLVQLVEFCSSSWIGMFLAVLMHGKGGGGAKDFPWPAGESKLGFWVKFEVQLGVQSWGLLSMLCASQEESCCIKLKQGSSSYSSAHLQSTQTDAACLRSTTTAADS